MISARRSAHAAWFPPDVPIGAERYESPEVRLEHKDQQHRGETLGRASLLLNKARGGEGRSRRALIDAVLPALTRMARGFVPDDRNRGELDSLVSHAIQRLLRSRESVRAETKADLLLVLRGELVRMTTAERTSSGVADESAEPRYRARLEASVGREAWRRYLTRVEDLPRAERIAVILFVEAGLEFDEIGHLAEKRPSEIREHLASGLERIAEDETDDRNG